MRVLLISAFTCLAAAAAPANSAFAQFDDLVSRVPDKANTLILLNVADAMRSPIAQAEGWRERHERNFAAGMTVLPPTANTFVMAAEMDFEFMKPIWQLSLMKLNYEPQMPKVAAELGGQIDNISGQSAVALPGDHYAVKLGSNLAALMAPANRQTVGRWLNRINNSSMPPLSPYLQEAVQFAENGAPMIIALDLDHVLSPTRVRERLETFESLKGREADLDAIAEKLASIRGVMLGITLQDKRFGRIKVDFEQDVSSLNEIAKPMLLEVLRNQGAMIDEFETWTGGARGKEITLSGFLNESGARRIMSLLDTPPALQPPPSATESPAEEPAAGEDSLVALSTQEYFQNVQRLLDDLRGRRRSTEFVTWGQVATWFDRYARKIERMPIANVDPEMLDWGAWVASSLRDAEAAMKGIGVRSGIRQSNLGNSTSSYSTGYLAGVTRWGATGTYSTWTGETRDDLRLKSQARARVRTQESIRGNTNANLIMQGLQNSMLDIRRRMTEKFPGYEF